MPSDPHAAQSWPVPKQGEFCWTEIASNDADKCQKFYEDVFGWKFKAGGADGAGMDYREFTTGGDSPVGGLYEMNPDWFGGNPPPPHFMIYVAVDDVDANAAKATKLGATIVKPPMDVPNVGRMCVIKDLSGAIFSTFQMKR